MNVVYETISDRFLLNRRLSASPSPWSVTYKSLIQFELPHSSSSVPDFSPALLPSSECDCINVPFGDFYRHCLFQREICVTVGRSACLSRSPLAWRHHAVVLSDRKVTEIFCREASFQPHAVMGSTDPRGMLVTFVSLCHNCVFLATISLTGTMFYVRYVHFEQPPIVQMEILFCHFIF